MKKIGLAIAAMAIFTVLFVAFTIYYRKQQLLKLERYQQKLAQHIAHTLDDRRLVEQLFLLYLPLADGGSETAGPDFEKIVQQMAPGAVFIYGKNIPVFEHTGEQDLKLLQSRIDRVNEAYEKLGLPAPVFAIDQEGGPVRRIKTGVTDFPSAMAFGEAIAETGQQDLPLLAGFYTCYELSRLGVHWPLAPVADVLTNPENPIIGTRSFGSNPEQVKEYASSFLTGMHSAGCLDAVKHFPGHGDTGTDSHTSLPEVKRSLDEIEQRELVPFRELLTGEGRVRALMSAHIMFPQIDKAPSTFSPYWIEKTVRKKWGYDGLILTDDLKMRGAQIYAKQNGIQNIYLEALNSGIDILLFVGSPEENLAAVESLYRAFQNGEITRDRLERSAERLLKAKISIGLMDNYLEKEAASYSPALQEAAQYVLRSNLDTKEQIQVLESQLAKPESVNEFVSRAAIKTRRAPERYLSGLNESKGDNGQTAGRGPELAHLALPVYTDAGPKDEIYHQLQERGVQILPLENVITATCRPACPVLHLGRGKKLKAVLPARDLAKGPWFIFSVESGLPSHEYMPYLGADDIFVTSFSRTETSAKELGKIFLESATLGLPPKARIDQ